MAPVSPQLAANVMPASPRSSSGSQRPSIMKRNSSQGQVMRSVVRSPGSEIDSQPLRHTLRTKGHARVVLPRNQSSGRNLAKLARQAAAGEANVARLHTRTRSHEGDTEIRLPGSLDESYMKPPPIKRNLTSYNLPRNASHSKLKKNYSHGQLTKLTSGKDASSARHKTPLSPALKGKSKRPKSLELDKDLHTREVELAIQQEQERNAHKKVGFRVGSADEDEDAGQLFSTEGHAHDEGEWTEESASVSPYSTRVNTANNSRRPSIHHDRPPDRSSLSKVSQAPDIAEVDTAAEADDASGDSQEQSETSESTVVAEAEIGTKQAAPPPPTVMRSPLHAAKEHPNPTTQLLLRRNSNQLPAPALISNVTAVDDARSVKTSPPASLRSNNLTQEADELVSRFIPSTSNGSGTTTTMQNTPKSGSFHHTPNEEELHHRDKHEFGIGPVSPGSTISGSSGAATPAMGRSRMELKMLQEKALADLESAAERGPIVPAHVYDRRNESLKSYLQLTALSQAGGLNLNAPLLLGPEIFQGRFKAVNTELKVVQKFRSPVAESIARLQAARGTKLNQQRQPVQRQSTGLRMSKSAVTLPVRGTVKKENSSVSTSTSPTAAETRQIATTPKSSNSVKASRRTATRGVSFVGMDNREVEGDPEETSLNDIAKEMWDSVLN